MKKALWMQRLMQMGYSFDVIKIADGFPLGRPIDGTNENTNTHRVFVRADELEHENYPFTQENPFYAPVHAKNAWVDFYVVEPPHNLIQYVRGDKNLFKEIEQLWGEIVNG